MKRIVPSVIAAMLVAAMSGNSLADGGRDYRRGGPRPERHHNDQGHGHNSDWVGPLVLFGVVAAALSIAADQPSATVPTDEATMPPVDVDPPIAAASTNHWYFCSSAGQYYP